MHVLINALQAGNHSGTGRYATELIRGMAALDDAFRLTIAWPEGLPRPVEDERMTFRHFPTDTARRLFFDQALIRKLYCQSGADLIHYPANIGSLLPLRNTVLTIHDVSFLRHPGWFRRSRAFYYRTAVKRSLRTAAGLIADSQSTAEDLLALGGAREAQLTVAPLGVGEDFKPVQEPRQAQIRRDYDLPDRFFLYLGTMEPRKNIHRIIDAWSRIALDHPHDLVIAGRHGWKLDSLYSALEHSPLSGRIHFLGYIMDEDLPALLSTAFAFVWPSLFEGFGLPPLEAMACGTPVITSNNSSLPEVVGDAALTVNPKEVEAIAQAMRDLIENEKQYVSLREKGLRRAADFTWKRTAELTLDAYRRVAGEGKKASC